MDRLNKECHVIFLKFTICNWIGNKLNFKLKLKLLERFVYLVEEENCPYRMFYNSNIPGLNVINKKILRILTKFSELWKFSQIFKMFSYQNILRKIFRNLSSQLQQNILSENFFRFSEKIGGLKIFRFLSENLSELRFLLIGLSPDKAM